MRELSVHFVIPLQWQIARNIPLVRQKLHLFYKVNIMGADVLAMQRAEASTAMIITMLKKVPAC